MADSDPRRTNARCDIAFNITLTLPQGPQEAFERVKPSRDTFPETNNTPPLPSRIAPVTCARFLFYLIWQWRLGGRQAGKPECRTTTSTRRPRRAVWRRGGRTFLDPVRLSVCLCRPALLVSGRRCNK